MFPAPALIPGSGFSLMWMNIATQRMQNVLPYGSVHAGRQGKALSSPEQVVLAQPQRPSGFFN